MHQQQTSTDPSPGPVSSGLTVGSVSFSDPMYNAGMDLYKSESFHNK